MLINIIGTRWKLNNTIDNSMLVDENQSVTFEVRFWKHYGISVYDSYSKITIANEYGNNVIYYGTTVVYRNRWLTITDYCDQICFQGHYDKDSANINLINWLYANGTCESIGLPYTTWLFNSSDIPVYFDIQVSNSLNFSSDSVSYSKLKFWNSSGQCSRIHYVRSNNVTDRAYDVNDGGWLKESYRTIKFLTDSGNGLRTLDPKFKAWIQDSAVQIMPEPVTITYTIENGKWSDGTTGNKVFTYEYGASTSADIPEGMTPLDGYAYGQWESTYKLGYPATANRTFKYRYLPLLPSLVNTKWVFIQNLGRMAYLYEGDAIAVDFRTLSSDGSSVIANYSSIQSNIYDGNGSVNYDGTAVYNSSSSNWNSSSYRTVEFLSDPDQYWMHSDLIQFLNTYAVPLGKLAVVFWDEDGDVYTTVPVTSGEQVTEPTPPDPYDFRFNYWCSDPAATIPFDFTQAIFQDTNAYGNYTPMREVSIYNDQESLFTQRVAVGEQVVFVAPQVSGKRFKEWVIEDGNIAILDVHSPSLTFVVPEHEGTDYDQGIRVKAVYVEVVSNYVKITPRMFTTSTETVQLVPYVWTTEWKRLDIYINIEE